MSSTSVLVISKREVAGCPFSGRELSGIKVGGRYPAVSHDYQDGYLQPTDTMLLTLLYSPSSACPYGLTQCNVILVIIIPV